MADKEIPNPADDVRDDVAAAVKSLKGETPPEAPEVPEEAPEIEAEAPEAPAAEAAPRLDHPTDPARYADGTFKPTKSTEAAPAQAAPVTPTPSTDTPKVSAPPPQPAHAPPGGWTAAEKAEWSKLPPAVQAAVSRREAEMQRGGQQWSEEKQRLTATLAPLVEETRKLGIPPEQGLNALLGAHRMLQQNAPAAIFQLAQQYGVDLAALAQNPPAPQPQRVEQAVPYDPRVSALESQLQGLLNQQYADAIRSFGADPSRPHFEKVREEMSRIAMSLPEGLSVPEILQQSYEQAVWLNPDIRAQLIAEQSAKAEAERVAAMRTKQAAAQKAAVSTKGSSSGAMPPPKVNGTGDVYDDVRAAIAQHRQ